MGHALRPRLILPPAKRERPLVPARRSEHRPGRFPDRATLLRIRAEFDEMAGFAPTSGQAARLFGLSSEDCQRVLEWLEREGFLRADENGRYHRQ